MARPIRCPKCGLMQMARGQCKKCGTAFEGTGPAAASNAPRPEDVAPTPIEPTSGGTAVAVAAPPMVETTPATEIPAPPSPAPVAAVPPPQSHEQEIPGVVPYAPPEPASYAEAEPLFDRDRFLLRQRILTIHEKYEVWNEDGEPIVYVERPGRYLRNIAAVLAGFLAAGVVGAGGIYASSLLGESAAATGVGVFAVIAAIVSFFGASTALSAKRHLYFYRDESKNDLLFEVLQDQKLVLFTHTYTVVFSGTPMAKFSKNILTDIFRKQWRCFDERGELVCIAKEDSILKALIRRFATRLLPLNFIFYRAQTDQIIGQFDRKFTLLDRYVLDMSLDVGGVLDRRVALALGVLLDTGERR